MDMPEVLSDYDRQRKAVEDGLKKAAKGSDSKILKSEAREVTMRAELDEHCSMVRRLMDEGLEMYRDGDFTFKEMVDDLYKALKAVEAYEASETPEEETAEHDEEDDSEEEE